MEEILCTSCDSNYAPRLHALHSSLMEYCPRFRLLVFCLDDSLFEHLSDFPLECVEPIRLAELENRFPELPAVKTSRTKFEYYFTLSPFLPAYSLDRYPDCDRVTYLDSDLCLFSDLTPLYDEFGESSILVVPHRFPERLEQDLLPKGCYNVGFEIYANDENARQCLEWWQAKCLEWCHDRVEGGRYADQKYLDEFPQRFGGVRVCSHHGANVAPWNLERHHLSWRDGIVLVDEVPLVFYHFQGFRYVSSSLIDPGLAFASYRFGPLVRKQVFLPYVQRILKSRDWVQRKNERKMGLGNSRDFTADIDHQFGFLFSLRRALEGRAYFYWRGHILHATNPIVNKLACWIGRVRSFLG